MRGATSLLSSVVLVLWHTQRVETLRPERQTVCHHLQAALPLQRQGDRDTGCSWLRPLDRRQGRRLHFPERPNVLRLFGGGAFEDGFEEPPAKCSHDIEYDSDGWYRHGDYLFRSEDQAHRLIEEPFCVKFAGSVISPFNWPTMIKSLLAGRPQRTVGMRRIRRAENAGPLVMIDGADDIATALQGSGVPQQLKFAMQAFVLYPLVLPIVEFGFRGAEDDHLENRAEAAEARDEVQTLQTSAWKSGWGVGVSVEEQVSQHKAAFLREASELAEGVNGSLVDVEALHGMLAQPSSASSAQAEGQGSSWGRAVRWLVSAQGSRLPRELRDHVEDEVFLETAKGVTRALARRGRSSVERLVRRLAVLEGVVRRAWEPRLRANLTSPLAMIACAGMWWAMLLHELAAFGGVMGGRRWLRVGAAARGAADWLLPVSQGCMALYGASVGVAGVREAEELGQNLGRVEGAAGLDAIQGLKASMRYQLRALRSSNAMAEVVAGPALFFGQALMALGGPSMVGDLGLLLLGSALTAFSIIVKIWVDLDTERKFGYNDDALSVSELLLEGVPYSLPSCSDAYERSALALLQRRRVVYLRELTWIKVLALLHRAARPAPTGLWTRLCGALRRCGSAAASCWGNPGAPQLQPAGGAAGGGGEGRMWALLGAQWTYLERYDAELHGMLHGIVANREVEAALEAALPLAGDPLFISFLFLCVLDGIRPPSPPAPATAGSEEVADADEKELAQAAASRVLEAVARWQGRERVANIAEVLERLEAQGLMPHLHEAVLDNVMVKGSWGKTVERWHRSFIEVVDCWEERTLKVPGIMGLVELWAVKHVKQAYRFDAAAFLKLFGRTRSAEGRETKGARSVERVAEMVATASWRVIEVHRKFQDRSELGCLNQALLELLRQRELRASLVDSA